MDLEYAHFHPQRPHLTIYETCVDDGHAEYIIHQYSINEARDIDYRYFVFSESKRIKIINQTVYNVRF